MPLFVLWGLKGNQDGKGPNGILRTPTWLTIGRDGKAWDTNLEWVEILGLEPRPLAGLWKMADGLHPPFLSSAVGQQQQ